MPWASLYWLFALGMALGMIHLYAKDAEYRHEIDRALGTGLIPFGEWVFVALVLSAIPLLPLWELGCWIRLCWKRKGR